jgi:TfoX/Sxy family transcriptional regulator of competence genes
MAYSETIAQRMRLELAGLPGLVEKKMFGGVSFMLRGNMACGVIGDEIIVRVGPERYDEALSHPEAHPFAMTGRPMSGWVAVSSANLETGAALREWVRWGVDFAASLPEK